VRDILHELKVGPLLINLWHALNYKPKTHLAVGGSIVGKFENERGIRQGAVSSPILFNVIPLQLERMIMKKFPDTGKSIINSLHFADDTTVIADSLEALNILLEIVGEWAD